MSPHRIPVLRWHHPRRSFRGVAGAASTRMKVRSRGLALAAVRDLRELRAPAPRMKSPRSRPTCCRGSYWRGRRPGWSTPQIRNDVNHLELIRDWFGRPLWEMQPADAETYFGIVLRDAKPSKRTGRAAALGVYFTSWSCATRSSCTT